MVIDVNELQYLNALSPILVTLLGIIIDVITFFTWSGKV
jgi:hypothetical protein